VRESDTVSRLGGDEFVLMIEELASERSAVNLAERILEELAKPFLIDGHELFVTTSIGITVYPEDGADPETLIKNADTAMYRAKYHGKNTYRLFTQEMNERIVRRLSLESSLRKALDTDQFFIEYQPRIGLVEQDVTGMEALVRWRRSSGDIIRPDEFIPLAEETGIIIPLGENVLRKACTQAKAFIDEGRPDLKVSVNLSSRQFEQADLTQRVEQILHETGLPVNNLELEITETAVMTDIERSVRILDQLTELGVTMSIDDFGTGYSSLFYLKRFPIGVLKIDRSFIQDITVDPGDANLVSTIMLMARHFNMRTVAEGVEERPQLDFLATAGCDEIQGYYFARPMIAAKLADFLKQRDWLEKMS
jgi:predicted signal transduction protein with EAL and GGDEF domain